MLASCTESSNRRTEAIWIISSQLELFHLHFHRIQVKSMIFPHSLPFLGISDIFGDVSCQISWFRSRLRKGCFFLVFFQYFTLESLPRKSKHMFFERFLMRISWKKVPPRKFTKVHESSNKNATKSTICRSTFSQIWMKPAVAQGNSHFFFECAGNELNSFIFIEIARFQSILYFFMDFKPKYHLGFLGKF